MRNLTTYRVIATALALQLLVFPFGNAQAGDAEERGEIVDPFIKNDSSIDYAKMAATNLASADSKQEWSYRGGVDANTVRDEDMKKFQELNHEALRALFASAEYGRKDPNWWTQLLTYAQYGQVSRHDYAKLAQDAIAAF